MDVIKNYNKISNINSYYDIIDKFIEKSNIDDILLLSRYSYLHCEQPLLSDQDYDRLIKNSKLKDIKYEDDVYTDNVKNIIKLLGIEVKENKITDKNKQDLINKFPQNQSMPYYNTVDEIIKNMPDSDSYLISFKHDGWNVSSYFTNKSDEVSYAHTRGRDSAQVTDCTELMRHILPKVKVDSDVKIIGELVLKRDAFNRLKEEYPSKDWVNIRSSISTFISQTIPKEYWDAVEYMAFGIQGLGKLTKEEQYLKLIEMGFKTPTRVVIDDKYKIIQSLLEVMPDFYKNHYSKIYECDGVTVAINNKGDTPFILAYKGGLWGSEILQSEIEEFYFSMNSKRFTPIAKIKPVISRIGNTISNVPLVNLRRIKDNNLDVGDTIEFEYQSQQNVYFIRKIDKSIRGD